MDSVALIAEIRKSLIPGEPLLVTGLYGSGKVEMVTRACRQFGMAFKLYSCPILDRMDISGVPTLQGINIAGIASARYARPTCVALDEVHKLNPDLANDLRHFLAVTSKTVVAFSVSEADVHADLRPLFKRHVHVPPITERLEDIQRWTKEVY